MSDLPQVIRADERKFIACRPRLELLIGQGHKALVFSQYTSDTAGVAAAASYLRDFNLLVITSGVPQPGHSGVRRSPVIVQTLLE